MQGRKNEMFIMPVVFVKLENLDLCVRKLIYRFFSDLLAFLMLLELITTAHITL